MPSRHISLSKPRNGKGFWEVRVTLGVTIESVGHTPDLNTSPDLSWSSSIDTLYTPADDFSPATRPNTPENDMASFTFSFQLPIGLGRDPSPPPVEQVPTTAPAPEAQPKTDKETKPKAVERILGYLREASITPLEMILIILDDENTGLVNFRNRLFEQHERIFDFIDIIKDHKRTSSAFGQWMDAPALDHVSRKVFEEGEAAKPFLRMETTDITTDFVEKWSVQDLIGPVAANVTPTLTRILTVATSPKFLKPEERSEEDEVDIEPGAKPGEGRNRETARLLLASQIHYLRSHFSCQVQVAIGLVAWANGCSQQLNDILHQADC
ncbi:hypothetical protein DFP72DRAFT_268794 [Ephemerocybe angulata]|uniref:Uncharacterized protein n=1 Tax=Ephemerocybe angulata TaxID=980116 RepID=A0A8H6LUM1_9AGAR|nr:hypothetical protein DFP72DRAFT_268794 [Tulosesus angulatus]